MARRNVTRGTPPRLARSRSRARNPVEAGARATTSAPKERPRRASEHESESGDEAPNFLSVYFREMSDLEVMSPEEEMRAAVLIAKLRREYWRALLAYPPFVDAILALIESKHPAEELPAAAIEAVRQCSRRLRDRETRVHKDSFEVACSVLAEALAELDPDGIVSDLIIADLNTIVAGQREVVSLVVVSPRQGSRPFEVYMEGVHGTYEALRAAKNSFVKANLRLVVSIARRFNHGRMTLQDLIQEGNIGLMKAVDRFDHRKGFRFSTYGSWWIRHAISRAIADKGRAIRLPVHMIDAYHRVAKAKRELETTHGREPSPAELASATGLAIAKIEKMDTMAFDQTVSLDRTVSEDDGRRVVDFLEDTDAEVPGERLEAEALSDHVREVISMLRPIEADILRKRFGLDDDNELTLKEIGEQYSLSRERIRQLQEQALGKIRRELKRREFV
jgi:RNA polymerase primary sigma factor